MISSNCLTDDFKVNFTIKVQLRFARMSYNEWTNWPEGLPLTKPIAVYYFSGLVIWWEKPKKNYTAMDYSLPEKFQILHKANDKFAQGSTSCFFFLNDDPVFQHL